MTEIKDVKVYDLEECIVASGYAMRTEPYNYLKEACDDLFHHLGLDTETAINIFLAASLRDMGIPFHVGFDDEFDDDFEDCCGHCNCGCDDDCCCDGNCRCKEDNEK